MPTIFLFLLPNDCKKEWIHTVEIPAHTHAQMNARTHARPHTLKQKVLSLWATLQNCLTVRFEVSLPYNLLISLYKILLLHTIVTYHCYMPLFFQEIYTFPIVACQRRVHIPLKCKNSQNKLSKNIFHFRKLLFLIHF